MKVCVTLIAFIVSIGIFGCLTTDSEAGCGGPRTTAACRCSDTTPFGDPKEPVSLEHPQSGGTLRIRISKEPNSLLSLLDPDPVVSAIVDHDLLEALVRIAPDGKAIEPELAVLWEKDTQNGQYTFHLDKRAKWHDGEPVTARDVEFTFQKLMDPDSQVSLHDEFVDLSKVVMVDDYTIILKMDKLRPDFLFLVSRVAILPAHVFGQTPIAMHKGARAPIGSGPFRFVLWVPGQRIELARSQKYRGTPPLVERIVYRIIEDNRVALDLFRRGDLDIVPDLPGSTMGQKEDARLVTYPLPRFKAWVYNTSRPIFARVAARRAVGMLIDRETIRCSVLRCRADLIDSPFDLSRVQRTGVKPLKTFHPERAMALLEADGWKDRNKDGILERGGVDFSFFLLLPDMGRDLERAATVVQGDLARAGIEMRISTVNPTTYLNQLKTRRFDASIIAVSSQTMFDPWPLFHSQSIDMGGNFGAFSNLEMDDLLFKLKAESEATVRAQIRDKIDAQLRSEHPVTFTFRPHAALLVRKNVRGITIRNGWFEERSCWFQPATKGGTP